MSNALYDSAFPERKPAWLLATRVVPATGASLTVADAIQTYVIAPVGSVAALTVKFPSNPKDQQPLRICLTQDVTLLTLAPGATHTISGAPAAAAAGANSAMSYVFIKEFLTWYRTS